METIELEEKRLGRPPIAPELRRTERLVLMLTAEEKEALAVEAAKNGTDMSNWIRRRVFFGLAE